jgi:hypothetical protein
MLKWLESRILWGSLLILGGIGLLLQNLGILPFGGLIWVLILGVGGGIFISVYLESKEHWWALIPSISLFAVAAGILLDMLVPAIGEILSGLVILGGIGLSFLLIYLSNRHQWWAVIPAGVLFTLAVVAGLDNSPWNVDTGGIFFLGLGLTFLVIAWLPHPEGAMKWAYIPAIVLLVIGAAITAVSENLFGVIAPAVLVLAGLLVIWRTVFRRR